MKTVLFCHLAFVGVVLLAMLMFPAPAACGLGRCLVASCQEVP